MRCRTWLVLLFAGVWCGAQAGAGKNLIANGGFDRDVASWNQWFSPGQADGEGTWVKRADGGAMRVLVRKCERQSSVQIYNGPFPVQAGAWYGIEFEARSTERKTARVAFMRNNPPYRNLGLDAKPRLGPQWRRYAYLAQASETLADARLDFFLPVGEFLIDNVVVRPLGGEPARIPVQHVALGRGVSGQAEHFVDGDPKTRIWLGGYPVMPAFVTLDLGKASPVAGVVVQSADRGRHLALGKMVCEVSADGKDWRTWTSFVKTFGKKVGGSRPTTYSASAAAVLARYVRLRVLSVKNSAPLPEVAVFAASAADPAAMADLPAVAPSSLLAFQGWDYGRNGYDLSGGEQLALRFTNQGNVPVEADMAWRIETYAGDMVARMEHTRVAAKAGEAVDVPIATDMDLKGGHYRVRFTFADTGESQAFYVDRRAAVSTRDILSLRIAAYLDTQDPEGWVWLSAGPLAKHLSVRRRLGDLLPQVMLVAAEAWDAKDERVAEVRKYVENGGLALFCGKVCPAFDDLLPVAIDRDKPRQDELVTLDGARLGLTGPALRQRAVNAVAKPATRVLAAWSNGTPAVVQGTFGKGDVVFVGAGLGRAWTQTELGETPADRLTFPLLYQLVYGNRAAQSVRALLADPKGNWCAERPDALSFGRFGWLVGEGGLVENIDATARLSCPAAKGTWGPRVPGREITRGVPSSVNWLAKRVRWLDGDGREVLASTVSTGAPCILWESSAPILEIDCGSRTFLCEASGQLKAQPEGQELAGSVLSSGWLVFPSANPAERDAPRYVQFARRPARLVLRDGVLRAEFAGTCGVFWTGRLFGIRRFAPGATDWHGEVIAQARRLSGLCLAFPVDARETGEQVEGEAFWRITDAFQFRRTKDEFGTEALPLAPVPPVFALVHAHTPELARIANGTVQDLGVATKYGPLVGVPGNRLVYEISQVADEHFGVVPTKGDDAVRQLADAHGRLALKVGLRAPSGLVSGGSNYLADLREYMACSSFDPPMSAPCIDLYKWWYCFPSVTGRPVYSPEARQAIDGHYLQVFRDTLDLYPHKTIIRYRREPWTDKDYTVSFIWPVSWRDGVRFFVDQNESSSVIAYCLWSYAQYYGDWDTVRANWHLARWLWQYVPRVNDWALMCSSNQAYYSTAGIDMLNSEYPGNLAVARMAQMVGDKATEHLARHLAAKSSIPAVARFLLPAYTRSITADGDPWRRYKYFWSMHEGGFSGNQSVIMRGDTWSILQLGIGMYDTSKGTGPEIALLYKAFVPNEVEAYEKSLLAAEKEYDYPAGWSHLMSRAFLGWPKAELVATAQREFELKGTLGWQSTKYPQNLGAMATAKNGFHLLDWRPAAYRTGEFDPQARTVTLDLASDGQAPVVLRAHAAYAVLETKVADGRLVNWQDDPKTGVWTCRIEAKGRFRITLRLDAKRRRIPCAYFPE
jgi:hypothetical protein